MVIRIGGAKVQTTALNFNPNSIQAAGQAAAQPVGAAVNELDGVLQKDAEMFYETQLTEFNIGMNDELRQLQGTSLGGEDYAASAASIYDAKKSDLYRRAGANPYKVMALDTYFNKQEPLAKERFKAGERELSIEHSYNTHERHVDNAMQTAGRTDYGYGSEKGIKASLGYTESGNNYNAQNDEGYNGKYQMGQARLDDFSRAMGIGRIDLEAFRKNPELQERVMDWHVRDIMGYARKNGLTDYIGTTINGVTVTQEGMIAAAHLGGKGGMKRFLESGGKYDPADSNGTHLSDYMRTHAGDGADTYTGPMPDIFKNPEVARNRADLHAEIDAMDISANKKAKLKANVDSSLTQAAMVRLGQENPSAALAALNSGVYDEQLTYNFDNRLKSSLEADLRREQKAQQAAVRAGAIDQANDYMAWNSNGRVGEMPPDLTTQQYLSLTPAQQDKYDQSNRIGEAVVAAQNVDLSQAGAFLSQIAPSGEGYADEAPAFEAAAKVIQERQVDAAKGLTAIERSDLINITPDGPVRDALVSQQNSHLSDLKNDQVGLMRGMGIDVSAIDPENLSSSLSNRYLMVSEFAGQNGVKPVMLTPAERLVMKEQFDQMSVSEKMDFAYFVSGQPGLADTLFGEISDAAPFLSHAGGVIAHGGDLGSVTTAMKGYQAEIDGVKFDDLSKAEKSEQMSGDYSEALRGMPDVMSEVDVFATNYARGASLEAGGGVSPDHYAEGITAAIGETYRYNRPGLVNFDEGYSLKTKAMILPPNVTPKQMGDFLTELSDNQLREMNEGDLPVDADGEDVSAEYIKRNADYVTIGPGMYVVTFGKDEEATVGSDGSPFVLRFSR